MATNGDVFYLEPHPQPNETDQYSDDDEDANLDPNIQNLRLTADNIRGAHSSGPGGQGSQTHGVKFNDCPTGVTKDIVLSVDPKRHNYGRRATLCEVLFGIVPGFFGSGDGGQDKRIMVQGLLPAGEALKAGIKIGEWLMSVNGQSVDFDNIDNILSRIQEPQHVSISYSKPPLNPLHYS